MKLHRKRQTGLRIFVDQHEALSETAPINYRERLTISQLIRDAIDRHIEAKNRVDSATAESTQKEAWKPLNLLRKYHYT
jgi:hypothetical protein